MCSFEIEGQTLYAMARHFSIDPKGIAFTFLISCIAGLMSGGFSARSLRCAKRIYIYSCIVSLVFTIPFFFSQPTLWYASAFVCGLASGLLTASWGLFLKETTPKEKRFAACANLLILEASFVSIVYAVLSFTTPFYSLLLAMAFLTASAYLATKFPDEMSCEKTIMHSEAGLVKPVILLCIFIIIFTVNAGLMYQVVLPAFGHSSSLTGWYWNVPYAASVALLRFTPMKDKRSWALYVGIIMLIFSFMIFMISGRGTAGFIAVNTLMLGALGIFDLFWWSVLAEMLDYTARPARLFGLGLAANVAGITLGIYIGSIIEMVDIGARITVILALAVICATLIVMPFLNSGLLVLLKEQTFIYTWPKLSKEEKDSVIKSIEPYAALTRREAEVFRLMMNGRSNSEMAAELFVSENTIKTHVRNILGKYDVVSRTELFRKMLDKEK